MLLRGSCHCRAVRFRVDSEMPYPYQACYCSICRKTAGGGGYAINLGADANTLEFEGGENLSVYNAKLYDEGEPDEVPVSEAERNFCRVCGSFLWLYSPSYPDLIHPFASAIDTPLPKPPEHVRLMLNYAAPWCEIPTGEDEKHFAEFPEESLEEWHRRHRLLGQDVGCEQRFHYNSGPGLLWIGKAGSGSSYLDPGSNGPENDFTNRNTTFMTWNLTHLASMINDAGGFSAHGNQRAEWEAGCRFDHPVPEFRQLSSADRGPSTCC